MSIHPTSPTRRRALTLAAAAGAAILLLTGCTATDPEAAPSSSQTSAVAEPNAADEMFVAMMIPHHQQAVEMSELVLANDDVDPAVADLAQRIKDAQGPEIELMESWLVAWDSAMAGHDMSDMGHADMDGMLSDEELAALEEADGPTASRLFLEGMIEHHEGAVDMAEDELDDGQHPDVLALAQQIIDAQQAEIAEMTQLLGES
ncbi:MAG: DUF305 domain-containing protein [Microbacterium sp.]